MTKGKVEYLKCNFCRKDQRQVKKLIADRDNVHICNECVELCVEILEEEGVEERSRMAKECRTDLDRQIWSMS